MKKKVYIINSKFRAINYGIGTYTEQLIECLKTTSIDFGVINLFSSENEISISEKDGYKQISIPSSPILFSFGFKNKNLYYRNVAYLLKEILYEKNIKYIFHLNFMAESALAVNLKKLFNSKIILVAHYTDWSFSLLGDYKKLKNIIGKSETELEPFEKNVLENLKKDKELVNMCDKLICVAKHSLYYFVDICHVNPTKCLVVNNALKDIYKKKYINQKNRIKKKFNIPESSKIVIFAGRLDKVKGVLYLIKAFIKLYNKNPNTLLYIAGEGGFSHYLSVAENYWGKIIFTGKLDKKTLYELYSISDIGVVSSIHEEFGFVAIEMMMHKLPLIVTNTGGLAEIVEENVSGLKIPIRTIKGKRCIDTTKMKQKIDILLNNPDLASNIAKNGRRRFLEKYELSLFKEKMAELYSNI